MPSNVVTKLMNELYSRQRTFYSVQVKKKSFTSFKYKGGKSVSHVYIVIVSNLHS